MDRLAQDLRYALRMLRKNPGFAGVVVLTLALGIGANTAIFTLMDQLLLRPLPVQDPQQLVLLDGPGPFQGSTHNDHTFSYPMYRDLRDNTGAVFTGVVAHFPAGVSVDARGQVERATAEMVSGNYFGVLGVAPAAGRSLVESDDAEGAPPVVMLSHGYWTRRFASDPALVGQTLHVNGHALTVVGIAPPSFFGVEVGAAPDLFVPLALKPAMTPTWDDRLDRRSRWVYAMARLAPGVTASQAEAAANVAYRQGLAADMASMPDFPAAYRPRFLAKHLDLLPGARGLSELRERFSAPLLVLMGMVGMVLLIACANVANLLIARASARQRELAIRLALGAGRGDIVRQLLVESLLLASLGGAAGLLLAGWANRLLLQALPYEEAARTLSPSPDLRVRGFTLLVSLATGVLFGVLPALRLAQPPVASVLKAEAAAVVGGAPMRLRKALVVAQVALSLLLLFGAGLFARSLSNLRQLDPGFDSERLVSFAIDPSLAGYDQPRVRAVFAALETELGRLPGVRSVSAAQSPVMADNEWNRTVKVDGYKAKEGESTNAQTNCVGPAFFATLGIPLRAGREFAQSDDASAPRVAIVNERFAHRYFGNENPIGRRFGFGRDKATDIEIVGLARDGKTTTLRAAIPFGVYIPYRQNTDLDELTLYVRSAQDEAALFPALRAAVARVDASLPPTNMKTMQAQVSESLFIERMTAALSAGFGLLATLLAALGLYGVMAYAVARRTREIGIRIALGAARRRVLGMVMGEVAALAALGIAIGLPSAWAGSHFLTSQLFGMSPADPVTAAVATAVIASVTLLAGYLPARRATLVEPMHALRCE